MDQFIAILFMGFLWVLAGSACIAAWRHGFDDIESRAVRVSSRVLMLVLWPAWLVFWGICVAIGITWMLLKELFE